MGLQHHRAQLRPRPTERSLQGLPAVQQQRTHIYYLVSLVPLFKKRIRDLVRNLGEAGKYVNVCVFVCENVYNIIVITLFIGVGKTNKCDCVSVIIYRVIKLKCAKEILLIKGLIMGICDYLS